MEKVDATATKRSKSSLQPSLRCPAFIHGFPICNNAYSTIGSESLGIMLKKEHSDLLTQTGPGTPMGQMFRRYWMPALLAEELPENDCPPVRVKLLSERLLAFRDSQGRYGLIDEFCAHRGVSLWFARNEDCGLRCSYHGWKYDVSGQCIDVPSEPDGSEFTKRIKLKSYPLVELRWML